MASRASLSGLGAGLLPSASSTSSISIDLDRGTLAAKQREKREGRGQTQEECEGEEKGSAIEGGRRETLGLYITLCPQFSIINYGTHIIISPMIVAHVPRPSEMQTSTQLPTSPCFIAFWPVLTPI